MNGLPADLIPLPTMPWDSRPVELPLDVEEVRTALWLERGNVTRAAARLKTPSARIRRFINNSPRLVEEMNEAQQQLVDIAQDNAYDALTDAEDPGRRDTMSRFVLQTLGKGRGWNQNGAGVNLNVPGRGKVTIQWDDGSTVSGEPVDVTPGKTIDHE